MNKVTVSISNPHNFSKSLFMEKQDYKKFKKNLLNQQTMLSKQKRNRMLKTKCKNKVPPKNESREVFNSKNHLQSPNRIHQRYSMDESRLSQYKLRNKIFKVKDHIPKHLTKIKMNISGENIREQKEESYNLLNVHRSKTSLKLNSFMGGGNDLEQHFLDRSSKINNKEDINHKKSSYTNNGIHKDKLYSREEILLLNKLKQLIRARRTDPSLFINIKHNFKTRKDSKDKGLNTRSRFFEDSQPSEQKKKGFWANLSSFFGCQ